MVAILHPTGPGSQIPIDRAVVLIGRSPECDVVLDVSTKISRMHCALVQVDADYYIRDLGSMNGVTVAGQRVEKDEKLTNGIEVMIGDLKFLFLENVIPATRQSRAVSAKGSPVFIDETVEVLDAGEVEIVEPTVQSRRVPKASPQSSVRQSSVRSVNAVGGRASKVRSDEIVDVEIFEDVEVIDAVEIVDDIEIVEVDVVEVDVIDVDVIEDVEVIDVVDIIDDVEIVDDEPVRPTRRRPPIR